MPLDSLASSRVNGAPTLRQLQTPMLQCVIQLSQVDLGCYPNNLHDPRGIDMPPLAQTQTAKVVEELADKHSEA